MLLSTKESSLSASGSRKEVMQRADKSTLKGFSGAGGWPAGCSIAARRAISRGAESWDAGGSETGQVGDAKVLRGAGVGLHGAVLHGALTKI